ncbi:MAG TPA: hypothetical protein VFS20_03625 [Longimicrobium sp.]|nr:hypothetical protein [Longimicrobium sp.]
MYQTVRHGQPSSVLFIAFSRVYLTRAPCPSWPDRGRRSWNKQGPPRLDGEEAVVGIAHRLLAGFDSYGSDEALKRVDLTTIAAFARASHELVEQWNAGRDREQDFHRDYETEAEISQRLQDFLMRTS